MPQKILHNLWRPFSVSQTLTIVLSLHLNSTISPKHVFIAVSDYGARKNLITWNTIFPTTPPRQKSNFPPRKGLPDNFPTSRAHKMVNASLFADISYFHTLLTCPSRLCLNHTVQKDSRGVLGKRIRVEQTSEIFRLQDENEYENEYERCLPFTKKFQKFRLKCKW